MSISMPNVLATDSGAFAGGAAYSSGAAADTTTAAFLYSSAHKSMSGENFHCAAELRRDAADNHTEGIVYTLGVLCFYPPLKIL